jgi:general secretion pathway protein H
VQTYSEQQTGFTLLELLVVMAIAGMLLALIVPRFGSAFSGAQFQQQVRELTSTLNRARNTASATGKIIRLELSATDRSLIDASGVSLYSWPEDTQLMFIDKEHIPLESGYLLFIPDAGSNGATLQLSQQLEKQKRQVEFSISWLTGGVSYETL